MRDGAIFWLKTRGGWRETLQDHTVAVSDLSHISDADLGRMIETLQAAIVAEDAKAKPKLLDLRPSLVGETVRATRESSTAPD